MPSAIILDAVGAGVVPIPSSGRALFANAGDMGRLYVKKPDNTIELLDTSVFTGPCSPCSGGGGGPATCADVANCIATDVDVQNEIINIINAQTLTIPSCPPGGPVLPGTEIGEVCVDYSSGCPAILYFWNGVAWIPTICPVPPASFLLQENGDDLLQENLDKIVLEP